MPFYLRPFLCLLLLMSSPLTTPADEPNNHGMAKPVLKLTTPAWQVLESSESCAFHVYRRQQASQPQQRINIKLDNCEGTVQTSYRAIAHSSPSNTILFANWESERGGEAFLFYSALGKPVSQLHLDYFSGDEDTLTIRVVRNVIMLKSSTDQIEVIMTENGNLKLLKKTSAVN